MKRWFLPLLTHCFLIAVVLPVRMAVAAPPTNDFRYHGENILPVERVIANLEPTGDASLHALDGHRGFVLESPNANPKGKAVFSLPVTVEQGAEYLFRAKVKSHDSLVARFGTFSMAYNDLGNWQTVTGLYRAADPAKAILELQLQPLDPTRGAVAEIRDLSLIRVERPASIGRQHFSGWTDLVKNGAPNASIVIPADAKAYAPLAASIRDAVKAKTGVSLPILSDRDATEADYPILKPDLRSANLIILGRLGNNRALWPAYNHFQTAVDGFYPGGDGYVIQAAANVTHRGENHLIIGGTSDEGVRRGTEKFLEIVAAADGNEKSLRLPWLLQTDLQGDCLALFKKDDAQWQEIPESPLLPKPEPGYGNVVRWYRNAMGYYWTGWDSYKQRADHYLSIIIKEKAYTHHYIAEFFVRTYNMLDESGVLSPEQTSAIDALFLQNFLDLMTVGELQWMTTFAPPYGQIGIVSRHQVAPWMSDYKFAEFITDILTPEGGLKELADFRRVEKERAFTDFITHRSNPSLPGGGLDEVYEEVNASFFRFALDRDLYREFFGSGNALKSLALERIDQTTGKFAYPPKSRDTRLLLGITASLTRQPELYWLWKHLPEEVRVKGYFQDRYLGQMRRYTPDADLAEAVPRSWNGIQFAPNPVENAPVRSSRENYHFMALRSGFEPGDDYLAMNGVDGTAPSGSVVSLISNGVVWLETKARNGGRFQTNTATAIRTDQPGEKAPRDDASRCLWSADLPSGQALRFSQLLSDEIQWTRDAIRLRKGLFVFRDVFTAQTEGTYLLAVGWEPNGIGSKEGESYRYLKGGKKLQVQTAGDGFTLVEPESAKKADQRVRSQALRHLKPGESAIAYTVMEATATQFRPVTVHDDGRLLIGEGADRTILDWNSSADTALKAALIIGTPTQIGIYDGVPAEGEGSERRSFTLNATGKEAALHDTIAKALTAPASLSSDDRPAADASLRIALHDATAQWSRGWSYEGFLKPTRIPEYSVNNGVIDLGEVLDLAEIRATSKAAFYKPAHLPKSIVLSSDPAGEWSPAQGERRWRPGVRTANYGEAHPVPEQDETLLLPPPSTARYVKAAAPSTPSTTAQDALVFFTRSRLEARHPLRLETGDFLHQGEPQTLVVSDVFPQVQRSIRSGDLSVALLDARGDAIFQKDLSGPVQAIRLLDRKGKGQKELFVLYASGTLEVYALDGTLQASGDLYKMHEAFAAKYSERKTRHPAGGYVLPFSVGLWRPNAAGERRIVIGRYGGFTFLNPDLTFEGVLNVKGYGTPGLLAEGLNFGNGQEEQVVAERLRLLQLGGDGGPTVRDSGGTQFWQQTYELLKSVPENAGSSIPFAGMPILRYELLPGVSEQPRYLLLARGTALSIYDARKRSFHYQWDSKAPLKGVAILEQSPTRLRLLVATADFLLWEFDWMNGIGSPPSIHAKLLAVPVTSLCEGGTGTAFLAGPEGLYRFTDEGTEKIVKGAFQSVSLLREEPETVVAATAKGEVITLKTNR